MKFEAFENRVIARRLEDPEGAIIIPDAAKRKSCRAVVVSVGPGPRSAAVNAIGSRCDDSPDIHVGDVVLFGAFSGFDFEDEGVPYLILPVPEIMAVQRAEKAPEVQN